MIITFWLLRAFLIFWARLLNSCAAINSSLGIVRFLFTNLLLLVIKSWLLLFGRYFISYATVHTPVILASLKRCMSIFVMVPLIIIHLSIYILMFRSLSHFTHLFPISRRILLSHGILKSKKFQNSSLPINSTDDINPNRLHIDANVLSTFLLVKLWLSVSVSILNGSLCLSQFKPSSLLSFAFVPRCSFLKFESVWEIRSLVAKIFSLDCYL